MRFSLFNVCGILLAVGLMEVVNSQVTWDHECGISKGCFPDCRTGNCHYLVTWKYTGNGSLQFTMALQLTETPGYLSIGFTTDNRMGDDSVVGCVLSNGVCFSSYNEGTDNEPLNPASAGISSSSVSNNNGIISCNFTRQSALTPPNSRFFDLQHNQYILMFLHGKTDSKEGTIVLDKHRMIPYTSDGNVDFTSNKTYGEKNLNTPVVKLHGIVMSSAWLLLSCIGIVTARYNKQLLKGHKLFGTMIWFQVHRAIMVTVLCLTIIGVVAIFVEIGGYCQLEPPKNIPVTSSHPVLGLVVTLLCILNVIGGLARPDNDNKWRRIFNYVHLGVGVLTQILAVSTVLIGYQMERAGLPSNVLYIGVSQLVITIAVCVAMEIHRWRTKKAAALALNGMSDPYVCGTRKTASEVYGYILFGYAVLMLILTLATIGLIASN